MAFQKNLTGGKRRLFRRSSLHGSGIRDVSTTLRLRAAPVDGGADRVQSGATMKQAATILAFDTLGRGLTDITRTIAACGWLSPA